MLFFAFLTSCEFLGLGGGSGFGGLTQLNKLKPSDGAAGDLFASATALSGNYHIIGARQAESGSPGNNTGAAYIFQGSGSSWSESVILAPGNLNAGDNFGYSVAIDGDVAVVGAPGPDPDSLGASDRVGRVFVFERSGASWNLTATLVSSESQNQDAFGESIEIDNGSIFVGASGERSGSGAVYVFRDTGTWTETQRIISHNDQADDRFGVSVAADSGVLVIGEFKEDGPLNSGAANIYSLESKGSHLRWLSFFRHVAKGDPA